MSRPPKILCWLLDVVCPQHRQDVKGDFIELYHYRYEHSGKFKASAAFVRDIITSIPLKWIIKKKINTQTPKFMFFTHLKAARRTLVRNKLYSLINLTGLSVGLAAFILITLFVRDELSYDKHIKDHNRIYRISGNYQQGGDSRTSSAATTYLLQPLIEEKLSGIETSARIEFRFEGITANDKDYLQSDIAYTDSTFFDIFSLPFVHGNPSTALDDPTQVVVDSETAIKLFGEENAMGKSIIMKDKHFTVSGVIENMPQNMHFFAHMIFPISGINQWYPDWVLTNISARSVYTYIKANKDFDAEQLESQCNNIIKGAWPQNDGVPQLFLQAITSIHLGPVMQGETKPNGTETDVYIFCITAIVILLLACINYINLSMAAALPRSKEAGIKRVLGSTVRMLLGQFQTESLLVLVISGFAASVMTWFCMPILNELSGKHLVFEPWNDPLIGIGLLSTIVLIAFVAGAIPAITLLRSGTIRMLSGKLEFKPGKYKLSSVLIVFQFTISVGLIASTLIVVDQIRFIRNANIGINTDLLLMIPMQTTEIASSYEVFKTELTKDQRIVGVTGSTNKLSGGVNGWRSYSVDPAKGMVTVPTVTVSYDFFETIQAKVLDGRTFSREFPSDAASAYVINEAAAELLGLDKPVGSYMFGMAFNNIDKWTEVNGKIIGVVNDFHFASLHTNVTPVVFSLVSEITPQVNWMEVRIKGDDVKGSIASIGKVWASVAPSRPFEFEFLDQALASYYIAEEQFMKMFIAFSLLSILLGALGLFGLTAFMTKRRTKEIGIRKVIGASTSRLISLLSTDFLKLVLIANAIGLPISWYFMNRWLQNFTMQTTLKWWIFAVTVIIAMGIAFLAILYHSLRVSKANPVKALRSE